MIYSPSTEINFPELDIQISTCINPTKIWRFHNNITSLSPCNFLVLDCRCKSDSTSAFSKFTNCYFEHMMTSSNGNIFRVTGLCAGNSPVPVNSPHKGQWRGALMFSLICVWINCWVNNREAGDLRRHRGPYDVRVMLLMKLVFDEWHITQLMISQHWPLLTNELIDLRVQPRDLC